MIAFGHKARSGKDTAASYLKNKGYKIIHFSDALYKLIDDVRLNDKILLDIGLSQSTYEKIKDILKTDTGGKNPALLQLIGQSVKEEINKNYWIDKLISTIKNDKEQKYVCADLRFLDECKVLKNNGFTLVKITRKNRIIDRDPNHISEIELDNYKFDYEITNDGTIDELYDKINDIINTLF